MRFKNLVDIFYSLTIFSTSLVVKEEDNLWLFGAQGGYSYSDNAKYFFEWLLDNHPNENCFWVTKDKGIYEHLSSQGLPVIYFYNLSSLLKMAKARYIVCTHSHTGNDVYKFISSRKKLITMWHGIPLKKMGASKKRHYLKWAQIKTQPNLFLVTSRRDAGLFSKLYNIELDRLYIGSYPRINNLIQTATEQKVLLYAPTFRDGKSQEYYDEHIFPSNEELIALNNILQRHNHKLVVKLHPYTSANFPSLSDLSNIELSSPYDDVQVILGKTSALITDYSSIYFDYLNLDRDIIFYIPDYSWYQNSTNRGLLYNYHEVTPGEKVTTWSELNVTVEQLLTNSLPKNYEDARKKISSEFFQSSNNKNDGLYQACKSL